jgi:hypothetical protein
MLMGLIFAASRPTKGRKKTFFTFSCLYLPLFAFICLYLPCFSAPSPAFEGDRAPEPN